MRLCLPLKMEYILLAAVSHCCARKPSGCKDVVDTNHRLCCVTSTACLIWLWWCQLCASTLTLRATTTTTAKTSTSSQRQLMNILLWQRNFIILHSTHEWMSAFGCISYTAMHLTSLPEAKCCHPSSMLCTQKVHNCLKQVNQKWMEE